MISQNHIALVERIRKSRSNPRGVPGFDPKNGNEHARALLVLEAPGPGAIESQIISIENNDPTARNLKKLVGIAGLTAGDIMVWNVVPWYCGKEDFSRISAPTAQDVVSGVKLLCELVNGLPKLQAVVLVGSTARKAHIALSANTSQKILACHHPSQRVSNSNRTAEAENEQVFKQLGRSLT